MSTDSPHEAGDQCSVLLMLLELKRGPVHVGDGAHP
jgi:hypothetical protein